VTRLTNNILTAKRLDALSLTMLAISHQSMDGSVSDPKVRALLIGAGKALCLHADGALLAGFSSRAKVAPTLVLVPQQMSGRRRGDRRDSPVGCVA
jgi:hypothetical protein